MFDYQARNPFLGDMNYLAFELFVEAGMGRGRSINGKRYFFDAATDEEYKVTFKDDFSTQVMSVGFNILSVSSGAFMYVRASRVTQSISERQVYGVSRPNGSPAVNFNIKSSEAKVDPLQILAIGGGYKF
jgi:hypothetical protein